jgi:hypothetical protein
MKPFIIQRNQFLSRDVHAYYHQDYTRFGAKGNPDFINHLKNQFNNTHVMILLQAYADLCEILEEDLSEIKNRYVNINLTVCVIPRAKAEEAYSQNQKLFRNVIENVVDNLNGYSNGTSYIIRHTDTITTHMNKSGNGGDGKMPYVGITKQTCTISEDVKGKDILLIDDIYTKTVNIDEDAIQALLDNGANSVVFYAVGKTVSIY